MEIDSDSKLVSKPMYLDRYTVGSYNPGAILFKQLLWYYLGSPIVRSYFLPFSRLKVFTLRCFGATIGRGVNIKPGVQIKFPWRLSIGHHSWIGENAWIDNVVQVSIGDQVCISQSVYLCTGNHDWRDPHFALQAAPITIESGAWIAARATIGPGVTVGQGAVLGLGSVAGRSLEPMTIYAGNPAQAIKPRSLAASAKG
jgi:putative colanic acid biosynthesis acetyltransferase WcaF